MQEIITATKVKGKTGYRFDLLIDFDEDMNAVISDHRFEAQNGQITDEIRESFNESRRKLTDIYINSKVNSKDNGINEAN